MSEEVIKNVLSDSGLTVKEAEVYIFLAKNSPLNGTQIAQLMKKDKAQIFRHLRKLQTGGFIESTLEFPSRFTAVPFESILNSVIKAKRDEVGFIEKSKEELLGFLERKNQANLRSFLDKILVMKGETRVDSELKRIFNDAKSQLCLASSVVNLLREDRIGLFDEAIAHHEKSKIQYRYLMQISDQNLNGINPVIRRLSRFGFNFRIMNPLTDSRLFPKMIIKDDEEILFFITSKEERPQSEATCLWTNCKSMVQAFAIVFENLWCNSMRFEWRTPETFDGNALQTKDSIYNNSATSISFRENIPPFETKGFTLSKTSEPVTEKGIINKILIAKKQPVKSPQLESNRSYGTIAHATFRLPSNFHLPDIHMMIFHADKQSSYGEEDGLQILLHLNSPTDPAFTPVAYIGNNSNAQIVWKSILAGTPAGENVHLVKKEELQVRIHGNSINAVWTTKIPLLPPQNSLPPASLLIEGYGEGKADSFVEFSPLGFKMETQGYGFHAFATFHDAASNYSSQGFDGFFVRDFVATTYPPSLVKKNRQTTGGASLRGS